MQDFGGKVAVVTGAASGIGLATTERFVAEGMKVAMADVEEASLQREVSRLSEAGADVVGIRCDVRDPDSVRDLAERTLSAFGGVEVVFNNAGIAPAGPMLDTRPEDWRWIVDVNILGVAHGVMTFGPLLRDANEGHIINTASEAGLVTNTSLGMYCASKHAVVGLSEALYRELEETKVSVHCLCPNLVQTKIFESERNRDDGVEMGASETATIAPLREAVKAMGITPAQVSGDIVEAMRQDRFWILTHDFTLQSASARFEDLKAGRNPSDPYAQVAEVNELTGFGDDQ